MGRHRIKRRPEFRLTPAVVLLATGYTLVVTGALFAFETLIAGGSTPELATIMAARSSKGLVLLEALSGSYFLQGSVSSIAGGAVLAFVGRVLLKREAQKHAA